MAGIVAVTLAFGGGAIGFCLLVVSTIIIISIVSVYVGLNDTNIYDNTISLPKLLLIMGSIDLSLMFSLIFTYKLKSFLKKILTLRALFMVLWSIYGMLHIVNKSMVYTDGIIFLGWISISWHLIFGIIELFIFLL